MKRNALFYGDNLEVLRGRDADGRPLIRDESVDLIYLDPPFNSASNYNVLFKAPDGKASDSQIEAFEDTWHWTDAAARCFQDVVTGHHQRAGTLLKAMRDALGENDMMAYLAMMAARLVELHRVLKPTGSLYLHCDPTASHYLKLLLDGIFGPENFRNEIVWKRTSTHNDSRTWSRVHDTILYYTRDRTAPAVWNDPREPHSESYIESKYRYADSDGRRYRLDNMTSPSPRPNMTYIWNGYPPPVFGWRYEKSTMQQLHDAQRIHYPRHPDGSFDTTRRPQLKRYLDEMRGTVIGDVWTDIAPLNSQAEERLGYPTQKPLALLERIIMASSSPDHVVLDPFCGCGTAVDAAQKLGRRWIGIDVTHLAISLVERRLKDRYPDSFDAHGKVVPGVRFDVHGVPRDLASARDLAARDKHQFQWWAVSLVDAVPQGGKKKGADGGIDGVRWVKTGPRPEDVDRIIVSVKGGKVGVSDLRELTGTVIREKALAGLLITLEKPTRDMVREAAALGYASYGLGDVRRLMVKTVDELLRNVHDEKEVLPPLGRQEGFRRAARERPTTTRGDQAALAL
jgi:site-specific DNA-methyltransferase (adenine-specific)